MTNRAEGGAVHRGAWDAIPWVVNGRASEAQRLDVEAHVRECDDCRAELERQRALHAAMQAPLAGMPDAQAGLAKLWSRIDEAERESAWVVPVAPRRTGTVALVAALAGAVVLEAAGIAVLALDRHVVPEASAPYRTLSQSLATPARATLRIVPAPGMSLADLQHLLLDLRLTIVDGPNEAGAYALAPLAHPPSTESQLARLRTVPGLRFAEPIATAPEPAR